MKHIFTVCVALLLLSCTNSYAQEMQHAITEKERDLMPQYLENQTQNSRGITNPPTEAVRCMAEWEEIQGLCVAWTGFTEVVREIVRNAVDQTHVYIFCDNANQVLNNLENNDIPTDNVTCITEDFDTIWIRDYGPWSAYLNDVDELITVDWIYNRPRPGDDATPQYVSDLIETPFYEMIEEPYDLVHTGGNFMVDGLGTGFASELLLDENPTKTEEEINNSLSAFLGVNRMVYMPTLPYDVIHHIDMHMKLLDEETLLVGEYPEGVADGPQIEANLQYILDNYNSAFGTPYDVVRIPMPPDFSYSYPDQNGNYRTYTNLVFVNEAILLPVYEEQYDTTAIRILEDALPGYDVRGIDSNQIIQALGAIHCVTKGVGVSEPLRIVHQPVTTVDAQSNEAVIAEATIQHVSGISTAQILYAANTEGPFFSLDLENTADDLWIAEFPQDAFMASDKLYYYIAAESNDGKLQTRPMTAPEGFWTIEVLGNSVAIQQVQTQHQIAQIYPNPSNGITVIPLEVAQKCRGKLSLHDIYGREVQVLHEGNFQQGEQNFFFVSTDMAPGVYFAEWITEYGRKTQSLIVK